MSKRLVLVFAILCCLIGCAREAPPPHANTAASDQASATPQSNVSGGAKPQPQPTPPQPPGQPPKGAAGKIPYIHHIPEGIGSAPEQATGESTLQQQIENWYQHLGTGTIEYGIPSNMFWKEGSTVTVEIAGPKGTATDLKNAGGSGHLKVSDWMKVELTCPDDPDEFTIVSDPNTKPVQFIAFDGSNRWNWTVTPRYTTSKPENLVITAWVLYSPDDTISQPILSYRTAVRVHVPGLRESLKKLIEGDPEYWLRYGLPGGGGFIFVAGCLAWLRKRSDRKKRVHRHSVVHTRVTAGRRD